MNHLERFSLSVCLICVSLIGSVSAQVDPIEPDARPGVVTRSGLAWGESHVSQIWAEVDATFEAGIAIEAAVEELEREGYAVTVIEGPEIINSDNYGGNYGWGAHSSWSVTGSNDRSFLDMFNSDEYFEFRHWGYWGY